MFFLQLFRLYNYVKIQHNLKKKVNKIYETNTRSYYANYFLIEVKQR